MTPEVLEFVKGHKDKLQGRVIEIGSLYINGSVRNIIDVAVGVDMRKGKGVDFVCPAEHLLDHFPASSFDACVSTETLEHVKNWQGFIRTTWSLVKPNGWLVMTMASMHKPRHAYPDDYWRMSEQNIRDIYPDVEYFQNVGKQGKKPVSIGWAVQKKGELGSLEFEPCRVE